MNDAEISEYALQVIHDYNMKYRFYKTIPQMFFNDDVSLEEELLQSIEWDRLRRDSEKRSRRLISDFRESVFPARPGSITDSMIDQARNYPVENLIEVKRGKARCISGTHEDSRPSMSVKNNRVFCFSCGFNEDSIGVHMKLNYLSFLDSVRRLS